MRYPRTGTTNARHSLGVAVVSSDFAGSIRMQQLPCFVDELLPKSEGEYLSRLGWIDENDCRQAVVCFLQNCIRIAVLAFGCC